MKIVWQGHDESVIEVPKHACRHCKQEESAHQERKCLFEPTLFEPMTPEEHARWLLELAGSQHIREKLRESGFFQREYLCQFPDKEKE